MWYVVGSLVVVLGLVIWLISRNFDQVHVGLDGETAAEEEVQRQVLNELELRFKGRFPERRFELEHEDFSLFVPNEHVGVDGLYLVVDDVDGLMVSTSEGIHWHFYYESFDTKRGEEFNLALVALIEKVFDHVQEVFSDNIYMYSRERAGWLISGTYKAGERPQKHKNSGYLKKEWSWSGDVPI